MTSSSLAKVLAVDDRKENLLAVEAILQALPIEVHAVTSGEDALKRLLTDDYAVILLDAHMPGMDGFETAERIKSRERTRHIPILFLTAVDYDAHLAFRGYQVGAVDYLTKPFDPWILRSKIKVFVDLWHLHQELADHAARHAALRSAVNDILTLINKHGDDDPVDLLRRIRERLETPEIGSTSFTAGEAQLRNKPPGSHEA
jgi:CheY-like chemotaxis protein